MAEKLEFIVGKITDQGGRDTNEDAYYSCEGVDVAKLAAKGRLYLVADGTGGQEGGRTASSLAVEIVGEHFYDDPQTDIAESLRSAIETAHKALYELASTVPTWAEMSTTLVGVVFHKDKIYFANVGDTRAYLIRDGTIRQITEDHIWLEDDENYGALTRWLGGSARPDVDVDIFIEPLREGDTVVLCTDGLTDVVHSEEIRTLATKYDPQTAAKLLVEQAKRRRTGDNVTVMVIHYGKKKAPAFPWPKMAIGGGVLVGLAILAFALKGMFTPTSVTPVARSYKTPTPIVSTPTVPRVIQVTLEATATPTPAKKEAKEKALVMTPTSTRAPTATPTPTTVVQNVVRATATTAIKTPTPVSAQGRYSAPTLLAPEPGYSSSGEVTFRWQWNGSLGEGECFDILIWRGNEFHYGGGDVKDICSRLRKSGNIYEVNLDISGAYSIQQHGGGSYYWSVVVVRIEPYERLGQEASPRTLNYVSAGRGAPGPRPTPPPRR